MKCIISNTASTILKHADKGDMVHLYNAFHNLSFALHKKKNH